MALHIDEKKQEEITTPDELITYIALLHGFTYDDVIDKRWTKELSDVRAKIAIIMRNEWNMTYSAIGKALKREHTTIISLVKKPVDKMFTIPGITKKP